VVAAENVLDVLRARQEIRVAVAQTEADDIAVLGGAAVQETERVTEVLDRIADQWESFGAGR
jgi:hypothetical protein